MTEKQKPPQGEEPRGADGGGADAPPPGTTGSGALVEPADEAVVRLEGELAELKDKYLRLAAEYDNFRKRALKERTELWGKAQVDLLQRLVDALDDLARFAHVDPAQTDAKTLHNGGDLGERRSWKEPQAAERFKEINEAHDVLSDPEKRKKYDQLRRYGAYAGAGRPFGEGAAPGPGSEGIDFDLSDLGSFGGLGDLFSSIFGRRGGPESRPEEDEIETAISIPFRVAALGGKVPVTLTLPQVCPTCGGNGAAPGATLSTCPECHGRGTISFGQGGFAVTRPCPVCRGRGKVPSQRCPTCGGAGEVAVGKHLVINVPPGTEDDTRLRLKGQGAKGRGDIVVAIHLEPDRF